MIGIVFVVCFVLLVRLEIDIVSPDDFERPLQTMWDLLAHQVDII